MISKETLVQLNQVYTKSNLDKGIYHFVKKFYLSKFFEPQKSPEIEQIIHRLLAKKQLNSSDTALLSFSVFANDIIYKEFLATLPKSIQTLIEKMLYVEALTDTEVETLLNEPITIPSRYYSHEKELKNEYYFFSVNLQYIYTYPRTEVYILSLHPIFKQILMEFYPKPVHYYFVQLEGIPETSHRFTAENVILQEMPKLLSYYMQDGIKYSAKGRPVDATLNKLQRTCSLTEFFPEEEDIMGKVRHMLMAGMLYNFKVNNINIDTISIISDLFKKQYLKIYSSQFILMHLKGWTNMSPSDYKENAEYTFFEVLKQLPPGKWISAVNLVDFIECRFIPVMPATNWALNNRLYYENFVKNTYGSHLEKKYIGSKSNLLVQYTFIKGTIFLLASFGLVEIAYTGVNKEEFAKTFYSAYDGLQYFRLTGLGAYVLGLSASYEPAEVQQKNKLQFSADSLMILAEGDMGVMDVMLAGYAEKAGNNRYKVTHAHFLKDCKGKKDIDNKIALFKKTIYEKLPPYWELQFKTWQENALKINVDSKTLVFKIPPDAKELQRLIAQDAVLKTLILKAEQFYILVPANNVSKFKSRMKELSYLVE